MIVPQKTVKESSYNWIWGLLLHSGTNSCLICISYYRFEVCLTDNLRNWLKTECLFYKWRESWCSFTGDLEVYLILIHWMREIFFITTIRRNERPTCLQRIRSSLSFHNRRRTLWFGEGILITKCLIALRGRGWVRGRRKKHECETPSKAEIQVNEAMQT